MALPKENEITPKELAQHRDEIFLVDVREKDENALCNLKQDAFIPLAELESRFSEIPADKLVVVHCRSGGRSEKATHFLLSKGYKTVKNLVGGILRYSDDVDSSIIKY